MKESNFVIVFYFYLVFIFYFYYYVTVGMYLGEKNTMSVDYTACMTLPCTNIHT